jgi:hypothetical protein
VDAEVDFVDVFAHRGGGQRLYAEAKGRTASTGLDVDAMHGQLMRRMKDPTSGARYAVVVSTVGVEAALRVPARVRERLGLDVYEVDDQGAVHRDGGNQALQCDYFPQSLLRKHPLDPAHSRLPMSFEAACPDQV